MPHIRQLDIVLVDADDHRRIQFRDETRSTLALFVRLLPKIKTKNFSKITIECLSTPSESLVEGVALGVYVIQLNRYTDDYFGLDTNAKKLYALELALEAIKVICRLENIEFGLFAEAYQKAIDLKFRNEWVAVKPKTSPDKNYRASVRCVFDENKSVVFLSVFDKSDNLVKEDLVVTDRPSEYAFDQYLGKLTWKDSMTVELFNKSGKNIWNTKLDSNFAK
jgi:hypothetical protein